MQPEVDMLARGGTCVTLATEENGEVICLLLLPASCTTPFLPHFMPLESPSIFSCLMAPDQSSGTHKHPPSFLPCHPYIPLYPTALCPPITNSTDHGCNMAHQKP